MPLTAPAAAKTYCRICEAACGLVADLDADGRVARLRPDRDHPVSRGFACAKGTRFHEVARHPARLLAPMMRDAPGAPLRPVSWEAAYALVEARLRPLIAAHGPHAVGVYFGNPIAFNALALPALLAFMRRLGTRNVFSAGSQDCNNKFAGAHLVHGSAVIHPVPDFARTELAVMFGTNPLVSQSSFVHLEGGALAFERLAARGGRVVWVDPRRTESAKRWGEHLAVRPGSDVWLVLALLHALRDHPRRPAEPSPHIEGLEALLALAAEVPVATAAARTGLSVAAIERLIAQIREARSAVFHMSVGVNQGPFGTLAYVALQALAYVTGNFDREGGVLFHPLADAMAAALRLAGVGTRERRSRVGGFPAVLDTLPAGVMADEILTEGPDRVRALVVIAGDPLASVRGEARLARALASLELLVCVDMFENATGRAAHLVLPTTSWLERWDAAATTVLFQLAPLAQTAGPVAPPPGATRADARVLLELLAAARGDRWARALARVPWDRWMPRTGYGLPAPVPRAGRFLRGRRRVRFFPPALAPEADRLRAAARAHDAADSAAASARADDADATRFVLLSRRRRLGHNGWLHGALRDGDAERAAWMCPDDLARLGLPAGGRVTIATDAGSLEIDAVPSPDLARGTVVVPHGLPECNVNAVIPSGPSAIEPVSGQHRMTGIAVRVYAAATPT